MTNLLYPSARVIDGTDYSTAMNSWSPSTAEVHYHPQNAVEYYLQQDGKTYQLFSYKDTVTGYAKLKRREKGASGAWTTIDFGTTAYTQIPKFYIKNVGHNTYIYAIYAMYNTIYYSSSINNGTTWTPQTGYSATPYTFVMIVSVNYNIADNVATVHFVEGTGDGTGAEYYRIIQYNIGTSEWDLKVTTTVDSTADTNFQYTCPGYYSQSEDKYYGLIRYGGVPYRFTYNDGGSAIISATVVGDGTYYINQGNYYPVMKKCGRLVYGLYKSPTFHMVQVWDLTIYSSSSQYNATESAKIIHTTQNVFGTQLWYTGQSIFPFALAIDITNDRILLWDEFHPMFYYIADYSAGFGTPIASFADCIITDAEIIELVENEIEIADTIISNTTFTLNSLTNIATGTHKYLLLTDMDYNIIARGFVNSVVNSEAFQEIELTNLNNQFFESTVTLDATDDLGTQLVRAVNQLYAISVYITDTTGSNYTFYSSNITIETLANTIELIADGKVSLWPDGRITYYTSSYPDSGITLSNANANIYPETEIVYDSEFAKFNLNGGFYEGSQIMLSDSSNLGSDAIEYDVNCPLIVDTDALTAAYTHLQSQQGTKCLELNCMYVGTTQLKEGQKVAVDLTDMVAIYPEIGASAIDMYVESIEYNPFDEIYLITLLSAFIYRRLLNASVNLGQSLDSLANDAQQQGNLYQPYAFIKKTTATTLTDGATQFVTFNSITAKSRITYSTSTNPDTITIEEDGCYLVAGNVRFSANDTGYRLAAILINGTQYYAIDRRNAVVGIITQVNFSEPIYLRAGDTIKVRVTADWSSGPTVVLDTASIGIVRMCLI